MTLRTRRGTSVRPAIAALELALLLPFLMFLWVVAIDWARIFYYTVTLEYAARDGCYYASNYPGIYNYDTNGDGIAQDSEIQTAALSEATNLSPTPTVTTTYDTTYNGAYASASASGNNYVQVKVTYTFQTVTNFPGVPSSTVLNRQVRMRIAPTIPNF